MTHKIENVLDKALTVSDLIEELQSMDPDAKVLFACDYGDISHTVQVLPVETIDEGDEDTERLEETCYSNSGVMLVDLCDDGHGEKDLDDMDDEEEEEQPAFVVLH